MFVDWRQNSLIVKALNFDWPAEHVFKRMWTGSCKRRVISLANFRL